jgi:hypothetical protein
MTAGGGHMFAKKSARDGSTVDIVTFWVSKLMREHKKGWKRNNEAAIYFALISHSSHRLCALHREHGLDTDYYEKRSGLQQDLRVKLYEFSRSKIRNELRDSGYFDSESFDDNPAWQSPSQLSNYWTSDRWRMDFFDTFTREFWDLRDYAHGAGQRKSDFLWDVAEVWVAAATSALVHFAHDDRDRWLKAANLVRNFANQIEDDGL